jgi:hypothetical protein
LIEVDSNKTKNMSVVDLGGPTRSAVDMLLGGFEGFGKEFLALNGTVHTALFIRAWIYHSDEANSCS